MRWSAPVEWMPGFAAVPLMINGEWVFWEPIEWRLLSYGNFGLMVGFRTPPAATA